MGISMAARSIVRLVSRRFSSGGKMVTEGKKVDEKIPTKEMDPWVEQITRMRIQQSLTRERWLLNFGFKLNAFLFVAASLLSSGKERQAAEQVTELNGEKTDDAVA